MAQIGTMKLQTGSGTVDVPVFETGDSGSNVLEALRVSTPSGTGFIPLTDPADAAHPYLRVQTGQGVMAVHDSASVMPTVTFESFSTGFESGSFGSGWHGDGAGFTVGTGETYNGSYSAQLTDQTGSYSNSNSTAASGTIYEAYVYWSDATGGVGTFIGYAEGDNYFDRGYVFMYHPSSGGILIGESSNGSTTTHGTTSVNLSSGTWYHFEVEITDLKTYTLNVEDATVFSPTTYTVSASGNDYYTDMEVGITASGQASGVLWDDLNLYQP